ncbi:DUF2778 domain-containing protein [Oryzibacter oryziterrae]|uniref:DUF2778 domain-containing protein n=1 Tax=Oryzibacter oryziterrae TaxID=2766474 RepID=UPI001F21AD42|nr:DUF2778 domain-containing protein [Oryzibacter oryziterrae]
MTLNMVGTMNETLSTVHLSSYDAGLDLRPLPLTVLPGAHQSAFDRPSLLPAAGMDDASGLTADAIRLSREKAATAALAGRMSDALGGYAATALAYAAPTITRLEQAHMRLVLNDPAEAAVNRERHALDFTQKFVSGQWDSYKIAVAPPPVPIVRPKPPVVLAAPAKTEAPKVVAAATVPAVAAPEQRVKPKPTVEAEPKVAAINPGSLQGLPGRDSGVAVYDLSAGVVYLPSGEKLEAHSGMGQMRDNIKYVHVKMRGATPPGIYNLTYREALFHGVQALRLTPTNGVAPLGRNGLLAHTYMLRVPGDSNGCVVFKNYSRFLAAFKRGEIRQMKVVPSVKPSATQRVASLFFG